MPKPMSATEVDLLYQLARSRCETLALFRELQQESKRSMELEERMRQHLNKIDLRIQRLKSTNELDRLRALAESSASSFTPIQSAQEAVR